MKFHRQRFLHDPDNGVFGDCMRTAIACVLDLEIEEVPHFNEGGPDGKEFCRRVGEFVASRGLSIFTVPYSGEGGLGPVLESIGHYNPSAIYLLSGEATRGANHVVVCRGGEILHDPHPSDDGLIGPCQPDGFYWVEILVPSWEAA